MAGLDRTGVAPLMPEEAQREIVQSTPEQSAMMRLMRKLPNMSRKQRRLPVLSALPTAYFVNGDTGQKQTTAQAWANKYLNAEEVACIVPIPDAVLDDADYDIWGECKPQILAAVGIAVDQAILYGTNKPTAWPMHIVAGAYYSQNVVVDGTSAVDFMEDINQVMGAVEADGYDVTGFAAGVGMKSRLRGLRATGKEPIYAPRLSSKEPGTIYGEPIEFVKTGAWDESPATAPEAAGEEGGAMLIAGDFQQAVYSIRQDVTWKILTEATLYDTDGTTILYRLAQQDMVALRVVIRLAWQVPNPINRLKTGEVDWETPVQGDYRYPFGCLVPAAV